MRSFTKALGAGRVICSYPLNSCRCRRKYSAPASASTFLFRKNGLVLSAILNTPASAAVTFDFGRRTALAESTALPHTLRSARPL